MDKVELIEKGQKGTFSGHGDVLYLFWRGLDNYPNLVT